MVSVSKLLSNPASRDLGDFNKLITIADLDILNRCLRQRVVCVSSVFVQLVLSSVFLLQEQVSGQVIGKKKKLEEALIL